MNTCTMQEFKQMAKEFLMAMPTLNFEELENGWKMFGISYLTVVQENKVDETISVSLFNYVLRKYNEAEFKLILKGDGFMG